MRRARAGPVRSAEIAGNEKNWSNSVKDGYALEFYRQHHCNQAWRRARTRNRRDHESQEILTCIAVEVDPLIKISLQFVNGTVNLLSECDLIKLLQ